MKVLFMQKINDFIDIEAPCSEVFDTIAKIERRMQLSPLWGLNELLQVSPDFPELGSSYRIRVLTDAPFGIAGSGAGAVQGALAGLAHVMSLKMGHDIMAANSEPAEAPAAPEPTPSENIVQAEQEYFTQEYEPPFRLSYALDADCKTIINWKLQSIPRGTRLSYEELFCQEMGGGEDFLPTVHHVVHEWLLNIKRYSELRGTRTKLFFKQLLDRFFLRLRPDQRRTVLLVLFMQALALVIFIFAAIGLGISSLIL
jgi:hypothetical protein